MFKKIGSTILLDEPFEWSDDSSLEVFAKAIEEDEARSTRKVVNRNRMNASARLPRDYFCDEPKFVEDFFEDSDYVTGFHKRKKKRRKEAQNQQQEALRRKRIELRKKRKLDREYVLYGGAAPDADADAESNANDKTKEAEDDEEEEEEDDDDDEHLKSVSGTKVYDTGNVKVMVTTSEISREDESAEIPKLPPGPEKKPNLQVIKKKPFKKVEKKRSRPKTLTKRDKRKGKKVEKRC